MKGGGGVIAGVIALLLLSSLNTMAKVKSGVRFLGPLKPTTQAIINAANLSFGQYGLDAIITSAADGKHMARSKHYTGDALDFRRWNADAKGVTVSVLRSLKDLLGSDYDIVLESTHFHVEYDPE